MMTPVQEKNIGHKKKHCCRTCLLVLSVTIFFLLLILFITIFVISPVTFKYSVEVQRSIIFPTYFSESVGTSSQDIKKYGLKGVKNFYVNVNPKENITIGAWQILPENVLSDFMRDDQYNYDDLLSNSSYNMLLYLHGNGGVRAIPLELYGILRKQFQIIACDYRGYADSTKAVITESGIVDDIVSLYKWLRSRTKARIFIWGHSLGTAIGTHVTSNLKKDDIVPTGLILETPFTRVTDVMKKFWLLKYFSWLPWFKTTFLEPIDENDFGFHVDEYILNVDCPIMILHAKDDDIIPYEIAEELYETAVQKRNSTYQGNITYHLFEAVGYHHMGIFDAPELPTFTMDFVKECIKFEETI